MNIETQFATKHFLDDINEIIVNEVKNGSIDITKDEIDIIHEIEKKCENWIKSQTKENNSITSFLKEFTSCIEWHEIAIEVYNDKIRYFEEENKSE